MLNKNKKILKKHLVAHETKKHALSKFLLVFLVFLLYFLFVSLKYGLSQGFSVTILTWSFFVFCTPVADAGFLLDFPIRLILKIRMIFSEIFVWIVSLAVAIYFFFNSPETFSHSAILEIYYKILKTPLPFWGIIMLSAGGTFLSVYFADELLDVVRHKEREKFKKHGFKLKIIFAFFLVIAIVFLYHHLLKEFNINFI